MAIAIVVISGTGRDPVGRTAKALYSALRRAGWDVALVGPDSIKLRSFRGVLIRCEYGEVRGMSIEGPARLAIVRAVNEIAPDWLKESA